MGHLWMNFWKGGSVLAQQISCQAFECTAASMDDVARNEGWRYVETDMPFLVPGKVWLCPKCVEEHKTQLIKNRIRSLDDLRKAYDYDVQDTLRIFHNRIAQCN